MNFILSTSMEVRLAAVFVLGACLGSLVNWGIYRLAWTPRPISPWSSPDLSAPRRHVWDRLPIFGWLGLRREAALHGGGFWVRPMLLELLLGLGLAWLYWWEISGGLLPIQVRGNPAPNLPSILHMEFALHTILLVLMLIGSMIDVDEMIIPDEITVPGTLIGLLAAAVLPWSLLPDVTFPLGATPFLGFLQLASPSPWPASLDGAPNAGPLAVGLACWLAWCMAILPRTWYTRHGWRRAAQLSVARVFREPSSYRILRMAVMGIAAILIVWYRGGQGWQGLLSALVGMAASGGLIWLVRIIGAVTLGREAMGFGDVTLMAMIGAFLGWQASLIIFFLAPVAGLVVGLFRAIFFRNREIPYGPFLCMASLFLIIFWDAIWQETSAVFELGWLVPGVMLVCLALMGIMLGLWRLILSAFQRR